ncbi:M14 family metallopeptidase [Legionella waltersii]|uniref:carboxypeptidase T n=1 Tax=Legionella waltersii TaxID=66969 RepID=A0A0W1ALH8_9GAMM|nr:M14 family metallopeptidase [Legionella waltersii]KTD82204.1 Carboxypeptidase T precursor [Legionella waltersii]SNV10703.1 Carboxypeptidase T precursor [Legionella waltersii]
MRKSIQFKLKFCVMLIAIVFTSNVFAVQTEKKQIIYVDFDDQADVAHAQLQLLKKMDVLGMNVKEHWAEVFVTPAELLQLQKQNLHIRKANYTLQKLAESIQGYMTPTQVRQALTDVNARYPTITKLFEAGKTHQDRPIMALEISANPGDTNKPVALFNGMHHAREVMTPEVIMHIAKVLTEQYGNDAEITYWLDHFRVVLVPQVNPDGNALVADGHLMWRKNTYKFDGDIVGVDLNRNYPSYWNYCDGSSGDPYNETYRGPAAGSEPETQAMMHLVETLKPVVDISYHSYSELILYPNGCLSVNNPAKDLFQSIGESMNAKIRNDANQTHAYEVGPVAEVIYEADGSDLDWQWREHGVFAFCIEVNAFSFLPDYNEWRDVTVVRQEGGWRALLTRLSQSGFRAHVQTSNPNEVRYSLKKIEGLNKLAFDGDAPNRTFALRSSSGLLYQLTEPGSYEITFYLGNQLIKTLGVEVGDKMVDLGNIEI